MRDYIGWRGKQLAYKLYRDMAQVQVLGFEEGGVIMPIEQKLEKKCRAFLRGVDLGRRVDPKANIYFNSETIFLENGKPVRQGNGLEAKKIILDLL